MTDIESHYSKFRLFDLTSIRFSEVPDLGSATGKYQNGNQQNQPRANIFEIFKTKLD